MQSVPDDIAASLVRSLGAYIRATAMQELPGPLRRFKSFRPQTLATRHRTDLLARLEDEVLRKRLVEWLDGSKTPVSRRDAEILRLAAERPRGWRTALDERSRHKRSGARSPEDRLREAQASLSAERDRTRKAREEARVAKENLRAQLGAERAKHAELVKDRDGLKKQLQAVDRSAASSAAKAERAALDVERERRKAKRETEKARADRDQLRVELKAARREVTALTRRVAELSARPPRKPAPRKQQKPEAPERRSPLSAPKGLFADTPETLRKWLGAPGVCLLVDGYNVTKSPGGYGELSLEKQRERVVDSVGRLARRNRIQATVVFDGSDIAVGNKRPGKGPVRAEYSRAGQTADDYLVAMLEALPPLPVIVVTSDRELQERAAALGATIATSPQLLAVIR